MGFSKPASARGAGFSGGNHHDHRAVIFYFNVFWSIFKGKKAGDNPWEATTLEWTTATPPPHDNFAGVLPTVYHGPYEFAVPGAPNDFVMQTDVGAEVPSGNGHNGHKH